jgi:putative membrane protein
MELFDAFGRMLGAVPTVAAHFLVALATWALAVAIMLRFTPADEIKLIRAGNAAAAVWAGGTVIAMALPIAAAMKYSGGTAEVAAWSALAAAVQLIAYLVACRVTGKTREKLEGGDMASALFVAAIQLAVALITAAALSG